MDNPANLVALIEVFPGIVFSFEFLDPAIFEHHSPTPKSDKPAINGRLHSGWVLKFVSHDAPHCSRTPLAGFRFDLEGRLSAALTFPFLFGRSGGFAQFFPALRETAYACAYTRASGPVATLASTSFASPLQPISARLSARRRTHDTERYATQERMQP